MRKILAIGLFVFLACFFLGYPKAGIANVTLPWSTTFTCTWNQTDPSPWTLPSVGDCTGISTHSYNNTVCSSVSSVSSPANNPGGSGGSGFRQFIADGVNSESAGPLITFNSAPQPELWWRFYFRYQTGFTWSSIGYHKLLYIYTASGVAGTQVIPEWYGMDGFRFGIQGGGTAPICGSGCGWDTVYANGAIDPSTGHHVSDGSWHYLEIHIKMDTNGSNGIAEMWLDGVQKIKATNMNYGTGGTGGWYWGQMFVNQEYPNNGGCAYVDIDDMAISTTGYIGPVSGTATPSPPTYLH